MNQKTKKVLIIDDNQDLIEIYQHKFLQAGFTVEKAENGAWGLKKIQDSHFDLVILDMSMPAMDGLEMLRQIEQEKKAKGYPKIISLSNTALDSEVEEMKKAGADECFIKVKVTPADVLSQAYKLLNIK